MSECPICLKKANYTTSCNHTFCKSCLYKWKQTCPLCRGHIELDWPNTRAMSKRAYVVTTIDMMVKNVRMAITSEAKLKRADKLLNFVWDNRIIIRKDGRACRMLHKKTGLIKQQCDDNGLSPPKILKKLAAI